MATIHIKEIRNILANIGQPDAKPGSDEGSFIEIRFNDEQSEQDFPVDEELKNKVITAECSSGSVTIIFDECGMLKSIDIC